MEEVKKRRGERMGRHSLDRDCWYCVKVCFLADMCFLLPLEIKTVQVWNSFYWISK